jgi:hypothetical protein
MTGPCRHLSRIFAAIYWHGMASDTRHVVNRDDRLGASRRNLGYFDTLTPVDGKEKFHFVADYAHRSRHRARNVVIKTNLP